VRFGLGERIERTTTTTSTEAEAAAATAAAPFPLPAVHKDPAKEKKQERRPTHKQSNRGSEAEAPQPFVSVVVV
jgi:hypothetical protein